jgi:hypothetical protein
VYSRARNSSRNSPENSRPQTTPGRSEPSETLSRRRLASAKSSTSGKAQAERSPAWKAGASPALTSLIST